MADIKSLEHPTLKVPYEILNKKFRTAQKTLDREVSHIQQAAIELEKTLDGREVRARDISTLLGGMVEKLQVLKRKAEESISEELAASNVCKRRLEHLKEHNTLSTNGQVSQGALNQWRRTRLDRMVVEYFLRNGYYNAAITLADRSGIKDLTNIDIFLTSREVEKSLANRETTKCLMWCHDNKSKLRKLKSNMEFNIRIQEFVELIRSDRRIDAIKHARKHFPSFEEEHLATIQQVMALLAYPVTTVIGRYKALFDETRWDTLIEQFRQENYKLFQLASQSVFTVTLQAGLSALKTPQCYSDNHENRNPLCPVCRPHLNELAESLPFAHCSQSRLYCFISGLPMNENNQPMMLPNGYIYGEQIEEQTGMSSADVLKPAAAATGGGGASGAPTKSSGGGSGGGHKAALRAANASSKRKNKYDRGGRKRSKSFSGCGILISHKPVLPSKFLLGGNIKDPLNLGSLQDEEINRAMNAVTPKSSPVPTPPRKKGQIEVIIPRNIHDPLNLIDCDDDADYEQQLCSPVKRNRKKRMKKRRTISGTMETSACADSTAEAKTPEASTDSAKIPEVEQTGPEEDQQMQQDKSATSAVAPAEHQTTQPQQPVQQKKEKSKRKSDEHGPSGSGTGGGTTTNTNNNPAKKFKNAMDKIVSPVVPQPGAWLKRANSTTKRPPHRPTDGQKKDEGGELKMPQFKDRDKRYQYGNYDRYYGYRNPGNEPDPRLRVLTHHPYLFENKDILDIGCNIGHITLTVARDLGAKSVLGVDIDPKLIAIARKNVRHYVKKEAASPPSSTTQSATVTASTKSESTTMKQVSTNGTSSVKKDSTTSISDIPIKETITSNATTTISTSTSNTTTKMPLKGTKPPQKCCGTKGAARGTLKSTSSGGCEFFPISMPILYGNVDVLGSYQRDRGGTGNATVELNGGSKGFPDNVTFKQCNYILEDDSLLANEQPQFDVILCLSMTKWIHLNWGDAGIKQAFRRMYAQLRPGGKLILEPQNWAGYKKRKKLTETIFKNYNTIEFFPEKFREYLLSPAVGFAKGEILGLPVHRSKGFRRPIQVFTKSTMFPSERIEATPLTSGGYSSAWAKTTEKECVEHVYTDLFDNRYCVCADDNAELNDQIGEELRAELEKGKFKSADGSTCDMDEDFDNSMPATMDDGDKSQERLAVEVKEELEEAGTVEGRTTTTAEQSVESEVKTVVSDAGGSLVEDNT